MTAAPVWEVSRTHDRYVLISDAVGTAAWRVSTAEAQKLIGVLARDYANCRATCGGTVYAVGGHVRFEWPLRRVDQIIRDLRISIAAIRALVPS
ncbi:hypothetical protein [Vineibacter terrae]|uniref:hypothetical protein n=1 Tax=Vineibacter terrae TaxID=2586908 RepID=UPI002E35F8CE|nr:hypothetical protein [Vineibacter terrae]HEX2892275.1 hypothetical protein [Vineibacter terrae]